MGGSASSSKKYITKQAYPKKQKVQINNLAPHLKELEEENKAKREGRIIKIRVDINNRFFKKNRKNQFNQELVF